MQQNKSTDLYPWLLLSLTPKIGSVTLQTLINSFGTAKNVLEQPEKILSQVVNPNVARLITQQTAAPDVTRALQWLDSEPNNYILTAEDPLYPAELFHLTNHPHILYLKGNLNLLKHNKIAMVGTRHPSKQGMENAAMFARELANNRFTIVSGMAEGIDSWVHKGALEGTSSTIGVIGTGIDQIYPKTNSNLFKEVIQNGLLLSEFSIGVGPMANNFPRRNRIIAALAKACLVVESAIDGGSMITANLALELGREVMAIPGSIHNPVARGCHKLIKTGAKLIETCNDIFEELYLENKKPSYNDAFESSDPILTAMGYEPIAIDEICNNLNIEFAELCTQLLELELIGKIINCGNGKYQRIFK
jgi:DNA processing protein